MSEEMTPVKITELICTRISHDLIGNVGAVANGVELLEEGDMEFLDDIKSILKTGSAVLSSRLKFFRLVFGMDNANTDNLLLVKDTISGYLQTVGNKNFPINLNFGLNDAKYSKAVLAAVMILADVFIRGGEIKIIHEEGRVKLTAFSAFPLSEEKVSTVKNIFCGAEIEPSAQCAPVYYLISLLKQQKINLYVINSPGLELMFE